MLDRWLSAWRDRRALKRGWRLMRAGDTAVLTKLAARHHDTALRQPLEAMVAKCLADDDEREAARAAFNRLYASLKGSQDRDGRYLKLYALFHLALIRNSLADAAYVSRQARGIRPRGRLRAFLPIPLLVAPTGPETAITSTF